MKDRHILLSNINEEYIQSYINYKSLFDGLIIGDKGRLISKFDENKINRAKSTSNNYNKKKYFILNKNNINEQNENNSIKSDNHYNDKNNQNKNYKSNFNSYKYDNHKGNFYDNHDKINKKRENHSNIVCNGVKKYYSKKNKK